MSLLLFFLSSHSALVVPLLSGCLQDLRDRQEFYEIVEVRSWDSCMRPDLLQVLVSVHEIPQKHLSAELGRA